MIVGFRRGPKSMIFMAKGWVAEVVDVVVVADTYRVEGRAVICNAMPQASRPNKAVL